MFIEILLIGEFPCMFCNLNSVLSSFHLLYMKLAYTNVTKYKNTSNVGSLTVAGLVKPLTQCREITYRTKT